MSHDPDDLTDDWPYSKHIERQIEFMENEYANEPKRKSVPRLKPICLTCGTILEDEHADCLCGKTS